MKKFKILGIAHITGGGLIENIPRILPEGLSVEINSGSWQKPSIFSLIQKEGKIAEQEMYRTFNMGIGMVLIVSNSEAEKILEELESINCEAYLIGQVIKGNKETIVR
jgi:phosphoribosylformylglycinamidine cyclo-ligase